MSNYEIVGTEPLSGAEVMDHIKKCEKDRELTYREDKIKDYLKKTLKLSKTKFNEAKKKVVALEIPRLEEEHIVKILEIMPQNGTELRSIVSNSGTVLVDESVTQILDVLKEYK